MKEIDDVIESINKSERTQSSSLFMIIALGMMLPFAVNNAIDGLSSGDTISAITVGTSGFIVVCLLPIFLLWIFKPLKKSSDGGIIETMLITITLVILIAGLGTTFLPESLIFRDTRVETYLIVLPIGGTPGVLVGTILEWSPNKK